ncbi:MAG: hypothetical protein AB4080_26315 [Trichodesmium sp.]
MKNIFSCLLVTTAVTAVSMFSVLPAQAASFTSKITYETPATLGETHVIFKWTGEDKNGDNYILKDELTDWSAQLFAGDEIVYTDDIITDGVFSNFGNRDRNISHIRFEFNLLENKFDEYLNWRWSAGSAGEGTKFYSNGQKHYTYKGKRTPDDETKVLSHTGTRSDFLVNAVEETNPDPINVPEPSLILGLIALSGLMLGRGRKTQD